MNIRNEDVREVIVEIPEGHRHLRTTVMLKDGTVMTFQEATVSNILRAFTTVKTHPVRARSRLVCKRVEDRKDGFAEWQLVEEDEHGEAGGR